MDITKLIERIRSLKPQQYAPLAVVLLFAVVGSYFLFASHADTPDPSLADDTGTYIHEHGDNFTKDTDFEQYILQQDNGKRIALDLPDGDPNIKTGTRVRIRGHKHGNRILVRKHQKTDSIQTLKGVAMSTFNGVYPTEFTTASTGYWYRPITNLAVIPVTINAADGSLAGAPPLMSPTDMNNVVFGSGFSAKSFFTASSYGQMNLQGQVVQGITINEPNSDCNNKDQWADDADAALAAAGVDMTSYSNHLYMFSMKSCPAGGWGQIGGSRAWLMFATMADGWQGHGIADGTTHELGHTMGMLHSNGYDCKDASGHEVSISTSCTNVEYGDQFDSMGGTPAPFDMRHYSNYDTGFMLGFLSANKIKNVAANGVYTLNSADLPSSVSGVQALIIPRPSTSAYGGSYELEYRSNTDLFDNFQPNDPVINGVTIRLLGSTTATNAHMIDMVPGNAGTTGGAQFLDAPLTTGTFYDPLAKISITVLSRTTNTITVAINTTGQAQPATVGNLDYPVAPISGGTNMAVHGTGFGTGTTVSVGGVPAAVSSITDNLITFMAPAHAAGTVPVTVRTNNGATGTAHGSATYVNCNTAAAIGAPVNLKATYVSPKGVNLSWTAPTVAAGACPIKGYNIQRTRVGTSTVLLPADTSATQTSFSDTTVQPGVQYTYSVYVRDVAEHMTYSGTINVTTPGVRTGAIRIQGLSGIPAGVSTDIPVTADFNGDGKSDMATFTPATGTWHIYVASGFTMVPYGGAIQFGQKGDIPVPADYVGAHKAQLAVFRPSTGQWFVQGHTTTQYGTVGDMPVPADYNGDGKVDMAVFRPSTGTFYLRNIANVQYGRPGDIPVVADYNGDHKADVAVFRPSTNQWWVAGIPTGVSYGVTGDIPVPADYNGDGKAELAVFRPSNGTWYVNGRPAVQWGAAGDIPLPFDSDGNHAANLMIWRP